MSFSESSNDSDWNISSVLKKESDEDANKSTSHVLKKRRKFREKWLKIYSPWLTRSEDDPNIPFCKACQCKLGNNGYRLQRHEKTVKHARNQKILLNEGEDVVRKLLNKNIRSSKKLGEATVNALDSDDHGAMFETEIPIKESHTTSKRYKTLLGKDVSESPYMSAQSKYNVPLLIQHSPQPALPALQHVQLLQPKKDRFDMFFDAISATVKILPPKLAAEVKGRISQVVAEFELRAICEKEAEERVQKQAVITIPNLVAANKSINAEN